jgi:hypothetical protein
MGRAPVLRLVLPIETRLELQRQALEQRRSLEAHAEYLLERWMRSAARRRRAGLVEPGLVGSTKVTVEPTL